MSIVHILDGGFSLCKMIGVPAEWPEGHRWVSINDEPLTKATCLDCRSLCFSQAATVEADLVENEVKSLKAQLAAIGDSLDLPEASGSIHARITWLIQREGAQSHEVGRLQQQLVSAHEVLDLCGVPRTAGNMATMQFSVAGRLEWLRGKAAYLIRQGHLK